MEILFNGFEWFLISFDKIPFQGPYIYSAEVNELEIWPP